MNKVELSIWIEENFKLSGRGGVRSPLYGVGINDAHYPTKPMSNGKPITDPAYAAWQNMLTRAYDAKKHIDRPTYTGVTVCKEWLSFMAFREWWIANFIEGWQLDKDILGLRSMEYSPATCIYVPGWLNNLITDSGSARGSYPIGVTLIKSSGRYQAKCCHKTSGKRVHLGYYSTPEQAYSAWLKYKLNIAMELKPQMDVIDQRIYPNVVTIIKAAV